MFDTTLKDQKLPGYANPLTVVVAVQSLTITDANMQAQWSIRLPEAGAKLPGTPPPPPLFSGVFDMPPPAQIMGGLGQYFAATAPGLVANLTVKAEAAAQAIADRSSEPSEAAPIETPHS